MALTLESVPLRCALGAAIAATAVVAATRPAPAPEPLTVCQYHVAHPTVSPAGPRHVYVIASQGDAVHERLQAVAAMTLAERTDWQLHLGLVYPVEPGPHLWLSSGSDVDARRVTCNVTLTVANHDGGRRVLLGTAQVELAPEGTAIARELARDACLTSATESATIAAIESIERGLDVAAQPPLRD